MRKPWPAKPERQAVALVLVVAVLALAGLLVVTLAVRGAHSQTVPSEVVRACVQVLAISVVGFAVGWATFTLQQAHLERQRLDDRVRAVLVETLDSYNAVKQIRRMLRAETAPRAAPGITAEAYSRLLPELCRQQLVFESLKRTAPLIQKHLPGGDAIIVPKCGLRGETVVETLEKHYAHIESYLNEVVKEYENNRVLLPSEGRKPFTALGLTNTRRFIYETADFRANASCRIDEMVTFLEETLLRTRRR
ncbi:hypothetical protein [Streptomyces sp. NPDC000888]